MQQLPNTPQSLPPPGTPYITPALPPSSKAGSDGGWRNIASTLLILIAAPLIAILLTTFVFQSYEVEGQSMETTLQHRDRLIVLKLGKTWSKITREQYIPKRGEIIVFAQQSEFDSSSTSQKQLIKRVIGLPDDRVVVENNSITIYNSQHPEGFNPDLEGKHATIIRGTPGKVDITVGEDEVFVCGDNRNNSLDSRNFGTIKSSAIVGRLALRIFPLSKVDTY